MVWGWGGGVVGVNVNREIALRVGFLLLELYLLHAEACRELLDACLLSEVDSVLQFLQELSAQSPSSVLLTEVSGLSERHVLPENEGALDVLSFEEASSSAADRIFTLDSFQEEILLSLGRLRCHVLRRNVDDASFEVMLLQIPLSIPWLLASWNWCMHGGDCSWSVCWVCVCLVLDPVPWMRTLQCSGRRKPWGHFPLPTKDAWCSICALVSPFYGVTGRMLPPFCVSSPGQYHRRQRRTAAVFKISSAVVVGVGV